VPVHVDRAAVRIRLGLGLFILSWLPIAQFVIAAAGLDGGAAQVLRAIIWGIQAIIGLIGLFIVGRPVAAVVRHSGWRHTPRVVWRLLRSGTAPADP
jgi:hypothetical protein